MSDPAPVPRPRHAVREDAPRSGPGRRVLVLGGTAEARELADRLDAEGVSVLTSLAGRTRDPRRPAGAVRTGGFGGVDGLVAALRGEDGSGADGAAVDLLVDATHPFAATMTAHAASASGRTGVPMLVLRRPAWTETRADRWVRVHDVDEAAAVVPPASRVLLAIGRQGVEAFRANVGWFLVRAIEAPDPADLPREHEVLLARGPFALDDERALLRDRAVEVVVAKDSGGPTDAKLVAARELGLPVVLVDRPRLPAGVVSVPTVDAAVATVLAHVARPVS